MVGFLLDCSDEVEDSIGLEGKDSEERTAMVEPAQELILEFGV